MSLTTFATMRATDHATQRARISGLHAAAVTRRAAGDEKLAGFYDQMAALAQQQLDRLSDALAYVEQAGLGATLRHHRHAQWATLLPDASVPGSFRYQLYDTRGFYSHSTFSTFFDAARSAVQLGFVIPDAAEAQRVMGLPSFERGNQIACLMMRVNAGTMTYAAAMLEAARIDAAYQDV